jgi:hypothetical protein
LELASRSSEEIRERALNLTSGRVIRPLAPMSASVLDRSSVQCTDCRRALRLLAGAVAPAPFPFGAQPDLDAQPFGFDVLGLARVAAMTECGRTTRPRRWGAAPRGDRLAVYAAEGGMQTTRSILFS